jgi:ankyrin repeat protein
LAWAAKEGHDNILKVLVEKNAAIEVTDERDRTPITWAAKKGHENIVRILLKRNASTTKPDIEGNTPLMWAIDRRHDQIVRMIMEKSIQENDTESAVLAAATTPGALHELESLFEKTKFDVNGKFSRDSTVLMSASILGCEQQCQFLLEQGADPNLQDQEGKTALCRAAEWGLLDVVEVLLGSTETNCPDRYD